MKVERKKVEITPLQSKILKLMEDQSSYNIIGYSAMGYREVADKLGESWTSIANSMRSLNSKGIFFDIYCENQWDDTTYFLVNPDLSDENGAIYEHK